MKTVLIFFLLGALVGVGAASLIVPPTLSWYNETGFLSQKDQAGQVQAMVNIPQVIKYATSRLIKGQLIGAAIGATAFLVIGIFVAAGSRKRRVAAAPAAAPPAPRGKRSMNKLRPPVFLAALVGAGARLAGKSGTCALPPIGIYLRSQPPTATPPA